MKIAIGSIDSCQVRAMGLARLIESNTTHLSYAGNSTVLSLVPEAGILVVDKSFCLAEVLKFCDSLDDAIFTVLMGTSFTPLEILAYIKAGVRGIGTWNLPAEEIFFGLCLVVEGNHWYPVYSRNTPSLLVGEPLTPREAQIRQLVGEGMTNKEIAQVLSISPGTVKIHVKHIREKTGASRYTLMLQSLQAKATATSGSMSQPPS